MRRPGAFTNGSIERLIKDEITVESITLDLIELKRRLRITPIAVMAFRNSIETLKNTMIDTFAIVID
jgi:hypothetical protein